jgi:hypothetical protein
MTFVVERSFTIERGTVREFERLSREGIWPYMEARAARSSGFSPSPTAGRAMRSSS